MVDNQGNTRAERDGIFGIMSYGVAVFVTVSLLVIAAALLLHSWTRGMVLQEIERAQGAERHHLESRLTTLLERLSAGAAVLATDPRLQEVLAGAQQHQMLNLAAAMHRRIPDALRVRLISAHGGMPEVGDYPALSFADIDMVERALRQNLPPLVEAHLVGDRYAHFDIVQPIRGEVGQEATGVLLISYPLQALQEAISPIPASSAYIELRQGFGLEGEVVLAHSGDPSAMGDNGGAEALVPNSRWSLHVYSNPEAQLTLMQRYLYADVAVLVLLIAVVIVMFTSRLRAELQSDLATIVEVVRDVWERKRLKRRYFVKLRDFRETTEILAAMGQGLPIVNVSDGDEATQNEEEDWVSGEKGGIQVEEIDLGIEERAPRSIFKAYDIRGIVGRTLTTEIVTDIGRAIGSEAREQGQTKIVVARDGRLSGPEFVGALAQGLRASGIDVIDLGMVPTPLLYFAAFHLKTGSGVMVTGSHNPPDYNGFKIVIGGKTMAGEDIQSLRRRIENREFIAGCGGYKQEDIIEAYVDRVAGDIQVVRPIKLVVDCGNGVAGVVAGPLLRRLGCEVEELYCQVDGHFPNHHPDPSQTENLHDLIAAVKNGRAELGLAFDGDGDRLGVIDQTGRIIWPDRQMMLYAADIISRHPGAEIIYDVKCSRNLGEVIAQAGGRPLMWRTGHSLIKAKMKDSGALLAGEMSGHIFFKERWYGFDDALYTAARLLEILAKDGRPIAEIFAALPDALSTPELRVDLQEGEQFTFMERFLGQAAFPGAEISQIDGLRADFPDGWGLVRASNTTPSLILRFEANDAKTLVRIQDQFRRAMLAVDPDLKLPF